MPNLLVPRDGNRALRKGNKYANPGSLTTLWVVLEFAEGRAVCAVIDSASWNIVSYNYN